MREPWATTKPWACTLKRREGKKGEKKEREKMREPWITKPWACTLKREEGKEEGEREKGPARGSKSREENWKNTITETNNGKFVKKKIE